jgi:probable O-glycosylation ligase (exosortase A-associated)
MRGIIVLFVCAAISVVGIALPRIALFGWIWFALMRPDFVSYTPGRHAYSLWMATALMVGSARYLGNFGPAWVRNPYSRLLILMLVPLFISSLLAPLPDDASEAYGVFLRVALASLTIPLLITDLPNFKLLYLVTGMSLGIHGLWRGTFGLLQGGFRMQAGIGGFMTENNTFGCGLVMVLPFIWCARSVVEQKWLRMFLMWMTIGTISTIIWTFSRGAALGLGALLILFAVYSRRKLAFLLLAVIGIGPILYLVRDQYLSRMETIVDARGDSSILSRWELMRVAPQVWAERPWFGVGLGERNFFVYSNRFLPTELGRNLVVHNSYLQILAHGGIFAFVIFMYMLFGTLWRASRSASLMKRRYPELEPYPRAIQASLIGFAVCSLTQPRAMFDLFYMVVAIAGAWHTISNNLPAQAGSAVPVASRMPMWANRGVRSSFAAGRG